MNGSYRQQCGVARAAELLGARWALLVVRGLLLSPKRYGQLVESLPGASTNAIAARLQELEAAGVVERRVVPRPGSGTVYALTELGEQLEPVVMALGAWGGALLDPASQDPTNTELAALAVKRVLERSGVPDGAYELRLEGDRYGLVRKDARVAAGDAPAHPDVRIGLSLETFWDLWTGALDPTVARERGLLELTGDPARTAAVLELLADAATPTPVERTATP